MPTAIPRGRRDRHRPRPSSSRSGGLPAWITQSPLDERSRFLRLQIGLDEIAGPGYDESHVHFRMKRFDLTLPDLDRGRQCASAVSIRLLREGTHWMAASRLYKRIKKTNYHGGKSDRYGSQVVPLILGQDKSFLHELQLET